MKPIIPEIKALWDKLIHEKASPNHIATGFALGFLVSFLPVPGQTLLAVLLSIVCQTNKVACLAGVHFHLMVFPLIPIVFYLELRTGFALLHPNNTLPLAWNHFTMHNILHYGPIYYRAMLLGFVIIGVPSAILSFFVIRQAAARWQRARRASFPTRMPDSHCQPAPPETQ
ncbi:MAG: DUF2062 domain-containing protein [Verrucomicrobiae bacterium]|nr:DUF2062 domain-containing protein [Verrucomicrobiae bacterium]